MFCRGVGGGGWGGNNVRFLCVLAHMQDVTLGDLLLHLHTCHMRDVTLGDFLLHLHTCHMRDVTLGDLLLHLHTCGMLRYEIFSLTCTHAGCYARRSSL